MNPRGPARRRNWRCKECPSAAAGEHHPAPAASAGGYPGSPYFKTTIAGTDRALAEAEDAELVAVPAFTGAPEQLWLIDRLTDGRCRIMPKAVPNSREPLALSAVGSSFATPAGFAPRSDKQRWNLKTP